MCPKDDSHLTLEFADHYLIKPSILFSTPRDYTKNPLGEVGKSVEVGFEYRSDKNSQWLTAEDLLKKLEQSGMM